MQVHIRNLIRDELRRQGHTNRWLADQLDINIRTVNKIFLKQTIDTLQLYRISKVLDTDFFDIYSNDFHALPDLGNLPASGKESMK